MYDPPIGFGVQQLHISRVVTISITTEAFAAIEATLPKGTRGVPRPDGKGRLLLTLDPRILDRLKALRDAGESYSDVILRIARSD